MKLVRGAIRIAFGFVTAISFALCLGICVVWARSAFYGDTWPVLTRDNTLVYPMSMNHRFQLLVMREWRDPVPPEHHGRWDNVIPDWGRYGPQTPKPGQPGRQPTWYRYTAVHAWTGDVPGWEVKNGRVIEYRMPSWGVLVEYYMPAFLTGLLPGVVAFVWTRRRVVERRRRQVGRCKSCGYDLRASTARCPECGLAIPRTPDVPITAG